MMLGSHFVKKPRVLVLGLGQSGLAMVRWCVQNECQVCAADTRVRQPLNDLPNVELRTGCVFSNALLEDIDLVAMSPGLSPHEPALAQLLNEAKQRNMTIWGELDFFVAALNALAKQAYRPKVLAITGTNGKTTTTQMTALLCRQAGKTTVVAGNIGPSLLDQLALCLAEQKLPEVWVLELSSFQLYYSNAFEPDAAAILNLTQDHLDWHQDFAEYAQAKAKILGANTQLVFNRDALSEDYVQQLKKRAHQTSAVSFGLTAPSQVADYGAIETQGLHWMVVAQADVQNSFSMQYLMPFHALRVLGAHNVLNAMAALALASAIDLPLAALLHGLRAYQGEPHRVASIAVIDGVEYIDDSKGTNVGATVAALDGLSLPTYLIVGGEGKGQDFTPLQAPVKRWCKAVFLIGQDAPRIKHVLLSTAIPLKEVDSLKTATLQASALAKSGEIVLLSPACASFDMFQNYVHRAQIFKEVVSDIALEKGVML